TDEERISDFQSAINDSEVRAILCARGGYGSVRVFDRLDWTKFREQPKWIIGFSDITVFHHAIQSMAIQSIHGTMPLNFESNTKESLETMLMAARGEPFKIQVDPFERNKEGSSKGELIGGNLSIIYSLLGSQYAFDFQNKILFVEDLAEQYYHIDRMLYALKLHGVFDQISGLIVGGMTDMKDTEVPFGKDVYDIVLEHIEGKEIPVCFDFPCGHINDNRAMIIGAEVFYQVSNLYVELSYV
ncbi:MAG: LD-carboxypeptidase, partial [Opitutales bacterium]|nr:LD-carboxypeptidase [Opitutales bacterium]